MRGGRAFDGIVRLCIASAALLAVLVVQPAQLALASVPYTSYTYDFWGGAMLAPAAYTPSLVIDGEQCGSGAWNNPQDIAVGPDDLIYVADTGNNRIVCLDSDFRLVRILSGIPTDDGLDRFSSPGGIFVTPEGHLYVADTGKARIAEFDEQGNYVRSIGAPQSDVEGVIPEGFRYRPRRVVVDSVGRVFVIAQDVYEGFIEFNQDGLFVGYMGAPRVTPSVADLFWSRLATREQRARQIQFIPTEFSSADVDEKGFIYTVNQGPATDRTIKRLNPSGEDVLVRAGLQPPVGDIVSTNKSVFVDILAQGYGIYSVLDRQRGRVFTYEANGNLLYVFGGKGERKGQFTNPVALDMVEGKILVLDSELRRVTVFEPTRYAQLILTGLAYYNMGRFDESAQVWKRVLQINSNYTMAHSGIGRALLQQGQYLDAMQSFRLAANRGDYSKAYSLYRQEIVTRYFGLFMSVILALLVGVWAVRRFVVSRIVARRPRQRGCQDVQRSGFRHQVGLILSDLRFALYVIVHPFDGFSALKHEHKGRVPAAVILLLLATGSYVFMCQYTGFVFNLRDVTKVNIVIEAVSLLVPFFLWCGVNWALTTIADGKGTFVDIFVTSAYALTPIVLVLVPMTVISNFMIAEEATFYYMITGAGVAWALALIFFGTMTVHEYEFGKQLYAVTASIAGVGAVLFIGLVFFAVIDRIISFASDVYMEIVFRQ